MAIEYGPKTGNVTGRIIFQILFTCAFLYSLYAIYFVKFNYMLKQPVYFRVIMAVIFFYISVRYFLELYFLPFWVIVDDDLKTLEIRYLMRSSKVLGVLDIYSYGSTTVEIRSKSGTTNYSGIVLLLPQEKKILLSEYNLDEYVPVEIFLMDLKIKNTGEESFNFIDYHRHQ